MPKYTKKEDDAIRQYLEKMAGDEYAISGNKLWQQMERQKVTNRSWSSMRDRYLKYIRNQPHTTIAEPGDKTCRSDIIHPSSKDIQSSRVSTTSSESCSSTLQNQCIRTAFDEDDNPLGKNSPSSTVDDSPNRHILSFIDEMLIVVNNEDGGGKEDGDGNKDSGGSGIDNYGGRALGMPDNDEGDLDSLSVNAPDSDSHDSIGIDNNNSGPAEQLAEVIDAMPSTCLEVFEIARKIACRHMATQAEIFYVLYRTNASLEDALDYFENGSTENFWTYEEDQIILGQDPAAIEQLSNTRGIEHVKNRLQFIVESKSLVTDDVCTSSHSSDDNNTVDET